MIAPKKRTLYRYAVDIFVELLNKVQKRNKPYRCNDQDVQSWNLFVEYYKDVNIGNDFVKSYVQYGIQSWFNPDMDELQKRNCRFSWIFGTKAIERYNKFGHKKNAAIVRNCIKKDFDIKTDKKIGELKSVFLSVRRQEECFKSEFFNTKKALKWCIANTSLYYHKSSYCASCEFKVECKELLRLNYPKIYKVRGYDE